METSINLEEASIYVGTYAKYNDGSLFGKWLNLSDYTGIDEFWDACRSLHKDEEDPEFMFQDWEHIPRALISESYLSAKFFELRSALESLSDTEQEPFFLWFENGHYDLNEGDADELVANFQNEYVGAYNSESDYAREYVELNHNLPEFALNHLDYDSVARDLFSDGYWFSEGHVFHDS